MLSYINTDHLGQHAQITEQGNLIRRGLFNSQPTANETGQFTSEHYSNFVSAEPKFMPVDDPYLTDIHEQDLYPEPVPLSNQALS
jgi:hypothetical protein